MLNSLFWGFLGVIFTKYLHPYIMNRVDAFRINDLIFFTVILLIIIIVDTITTIIKVHNININLEKLKEITNTIKEKLEELETKQISKENIQDMIEDLKYRQTKIRRKLIRQTNRLKKAFPTMKSDVIEKINEFVKEKRDTIKEKQNNRSK